MKIKVKIHSICNISKHFYVFWPKPNDFDDKKFLSPSIYTTFTERLFLEEIKRF